MKETKGLQIPFMDDAKKSELKSAVEALLFASGEPLSIYELSNHLDEKSKTIELIIQEMMDAYEKVQTRGIKLISIKGKYQLVTKGENAEYIQKLLKKNKRQSLSQASIESLAIISYKQPITRIDIDEIRGVKSESALQRLIEKDLIKEVGRLEVPGRPILYGTTDEFLRQFDLRDLKDLPSLDLFGQDDDEVTSVEIENNEKYYDVDEEKTINNLE
ncbi:SMC-Scp complex subunit ScpB [Clostridium butyricum]|uniref:Segregation and condensation protein B n=2 Tax=Clostridium butyricum TaxID=1492 RepID=C4IIQ8_CLOBU|nr:SMC-Scp complex subunit ScpB [Clostridium butyricum]ETI90659.1 MAG: Segregation and condensation protein B [Clostridium butyricum DORA_1]APF23489.1 segregation and condensation protein B [Clostridium butyricum]EDT76845.1 segregation and condensation protein B [Clostridium butyricum 5521]EEP54816.1 segregation and condensation protein B [Clostridium butyricum E4 str. BoNT E BL5262]KHD16311.1 segregation and condensation protein B [Clostridium butyricum]